jgi:hypothetical protein
MSASAIPCLPAGLSKITSRDALLVCVCTAYSAELLTPDAEIPSTSIFTVRHTYPAGKQSSRRSSKTKSCVHISNQILELTKPIHAMSTRQPDGSANQPGDKVTEPPTIAAPNRAAVRPRRGTQRATGKRKAEKTTLPVMFATNTCPKLR